MVDDSRSPDSGQRPVKMLLRATKGRGAVSNPQGRFAFDRRKAFDDGWYREDGEPPPLKTVVTIEAARSIIARNQSPDIFFDQSINPYRGCEHGCIYCYARPNHSYVGLSPGLDFEARLFAKTNAADLLRHELSASGYRCDPIAIGTVTDAYQPIEREYRITRQLLQVLSECSHPVSLITKSSLIERDIDLLAPMARKGMVMVNITLTTLDPGLASSWEPRAAAPWRRLETIRRLSEAGIPVGVSVSPIAPFINEPELERVLEAAHQAGARAAHYIVLRLPWELKEIFSDWLSEYFPQRATRVMNRITEMRGGDKVNDPRFFTRMKGEGAWAELIHMRFEIAARKLGLNRDRLKLRTDQFVPPRSDSQMGLF